MAEDKKAKLEEKEAIDSVVQGKKAPASKAVVLELKTAGTLASRGKRFTSGIPAKIENPELAERLLASGLFKMAGDKK